MNDQRIKLLKTYIASEPDNPFNKYALAMEYYNHEPTQSAHLLEELLADHPDYLPTYFKAANLFWSLDEIAKAEATFKKGIDLAKRLKDNKALLELNSAYQNFQFDVLD